MADESKSVADEAKSFSQEIVTTLGLVELILGGVALYGTSLIFKDSSVNVLFPSAGNSFVDVGLQLFAAALVGKIIYLIVAFLIAIVLRRTSKDQSYSVPLKKALGKFYDDTELQEIEDSKTTLIEMAVKHLSCADAYQRIAFDRHRMRIIVAYGTSILIVIFLTYLFCIKRQETPSNLLIFLVIAFFIFIFLGFLEQRSFFSEATQSLIALHKHEEQKRAESKDPKDN
jgi:hypothetical protein